MAMYTLTDNLPDEEVAFTFDWDTGREAAAQWVKDRRNDAHACEGVDPDDWADALEWRDSLVNQIRAGKIDKSDLGLWEFSLTELPVA